MSSSPQNQPPEQKRGVMNDEELDALFNETINAKKIAVDTVMRTQDVAYNDEVLAAANVLLERYRKEFKATVKSRDQQIALAAREAENEEWVKKYSEALELLRQHHPEGSATQRALEQVVSDHQNRIVTLKENKQ